MNTLSFKTTLTLALIVLSSGTTRTSSFARMAKRAVPVASLAFFAQQTQQQKANQTDEAKKPTVTSQPTSTGPTFNTPIAAAVAQTKTPTALSWIRSLLPTVRCEETEQQPSAEQKPSIDFSKIRKVSEIDDVVTSKLESLPLIAKYILPNGKELWFFLDRHDNPQSKCSNFVKTLIANENFRHGIIECEILTSALLYNDPFTSFQEIYDSYKDSYNKTMSDIQVFFNLFLDLDPFKIENIEEYDLQETIAREYLLLKTIDQGLESLKIIVEKDAINIACMLLSKQKKIIVPGEFPTPQEAIEAYEQEGLSPDQMIYNQYMYFGKLSFDAAIDLFGEKNFSSEFTKEFTKEEYTEIHNTIMFARDKKIAQTIIETINNSEAKKVLTVYGGFHHATLAPLLEEHFGKPTFITPEYYAETIKQRLFSNDAMTSEEYEGSLAYHKNEYPL